MNISLRTLATCGTLFFGLNLGLLAAAADETPATQSARPMEKTLLLVASPDLVPLFGGKHGGGGP